MRSIHSCLPVACLTAALSACATPENTVVFVTKTSLGIDVEQAPASASFAYDRTEGYFGPRFQDGTVAPVVAAFNTNGGLIDRDIKHLFATGRAAGIATAPGGASEASPPARPARRAGVNGKLPSKSMFFGTSTVLGIKLGFDNAAIDSFTLGFKRKEMSVIPTDDQDVPSVLATFHSQLKARSRVNDSLGVEQFFATGLPAEQIANTPQIRASFRNMAEQKLEQTHTD